MRDVLVMSIDPIGCEDVDDALSVRKLENGNLEVREILGLVNIRQ